jgi:glucose/mannose-6-phosphate isomerase
MVVVLSYSGETEEALSLYADARRRGAMVAVVTTGGDLARRAADDGAPVHFVRYSSLPRAAIAHTLAPLLRLGLMLGMCDVTDQWVIRAGAMHREFVSEYLRPTCPFAKNGAKRLASAIAGRTALVVGAEHLAPVAARFKNQLAENGKSLAAVDYLPELDHNVVVGLETGAAPAGWLTLVSMESRLYDDRTRARCDVTAAQFAAAGIPVERFEVGGETLLEQVLIGTAWGDYVSCYVALLNGLDPTPIQQIDVIKAARAAQSAPA